MAKIPASLPIQYPVHPSQNWLESFVNMLQQIWQQAAVIINGRLSFGDGVDADNIDGVWSTTTTPGVARTDFTITHNLNRIPVGYLEVSSSAPCDIYDGSIAATATQLTLRATGIGVSVKLFIF